MKIILSIFLCLIFVGVGFGQKAQSAVKKYGLYGKLQAQSGKGQMLGEILLQAAKLLANAKGCVLYVVNQDAADPDSLYIYEVWENKQDHDNSLKLPKIGALIKQALPIIAGKPDAGMTFEVLGGKGIKH